MKLEAVFMLAPLLVCVLYGEGDYFSFITPAAILIAAGFILTVKKPLNKEMSAHDGFVTVAVAWIIISLFGALPFMLSGDIPNYIDAVFETFQKLLDEEEEEE